MVDESATTLAQKSAPPRISYRLKELAAAAGIPYRTVLHQVVTGKIPSMTFGSIRVIPASYVEARLMSVRDVS
jgi:hypothetical protein